ncbi:hypothetical protein C8R44DRAFT_655621 [Mycena epipterygia]|nr:hypothetical protein C8R44DRAFT_655621 [Mycena epipterygia]
MTTLSAPASSSSLLPPYSPSPPVPSYSPEPAHDEQRVEHTPRAHSHPSGNYIKKCGHDVVVLTEQDGTAEVPTYGRHASINGYVTLEDRTTVSEIVLKIKGTMDVMISEGGSLTTKLVHDNYTIWSSRKSHTSTCPSAVPFSVVLPTTFQDDDGIPHTLPPSYDVPFITVPGLFFKSSYILSVTITRIRSRKFQFLSKSKTIPIRFNYSPRLRPWRPIQPSSDFFSDIKTMPEEWRQVVSQFKPRPKSPAQPIDMHLFLPMAEIFGLDDTIPFHVQLTGSVSSLREFLPESGDTASPGKTTISGTLVRQIIVDINGRRASRSFVVGHAKLASSPPGAAADAHEASLDWDGEVRCKADTLIGAFNAGCVRVQDFIVIELRPPNTKVSSQFTTLKHSHPIKLVTDSWLDSSEPR